MHQQILQMFIDVFLILLHPIFIKWIELCSISTKISRFLLISFKHNLFDIFNILRFRLAWHSINLSIIKFFHCI
ncbi:hypothetical protein Hanom_Chr16g01468431 [Helianthus anomalus]